MISSSLRAKIIFFKRISQQSEPASDVEPLKAEIENFSRKKRKAIDIMLDELLSREYIEIIFPDNNARYIAVNDGVDTAKSENELVAFKNICNDWFAHDTSRKIKAVFKAKGQSGKPLEPIPPYGYRKSDADKNIWEVDEEAAEVVRRIFRMCIEGF